MQWDCQKKTLAQQQVEWVQLFYFHHQWLQSVPIPLVQSTDMVPSQTVPIPLVQSNDMVLGIQAEVVQVVGHPSQHQQGRGEKCGISRWSNLLGFVKKGLTRLQSNTVILREWPEPVAEKALSVLSTDDGNSDLTSMVLSSRRQFRYQHLYTRLQKLSF